MKKVEAFLFLAMLLMPFAAYSQGASTGVGLTIIDTTAPVINLTSPLNNSGNMNKNVTFFYNVSDLSDLNNCSLIINNKINATNESTITKNARLSFSVNNTALGRYNWSINCTDNLGFNGSSENRTFSVVFMTKFNGSTTNLSSVDLRNITPFVLEVTTSGKINFSESVNLSQGFDLDRYINVSFNRIELDSTELSALNKSATLYLYGLTFTNPRALIDGAVCPSSICTEVPPYNGGTFVFNVTHFTAYSSEETPSGGGDSGLGSSGGDSGGGGGGGGGGIQTVLDFTTDKKTIKVVLKQGQTKEETLSIKNTGTTALDVTTYLQALKEFIISPSLDEIKTILNPNEEQLLNFVFGAGENSKPDVYTGVIKIKGGAIEKIVNAIIEVESAKPLFDVDVEVLPQYKSIFPGDDVFVDVSLFNVRGFGRVDVVLEYSIRDFEGNTIAKEEETVAVETQAKFTRELLVPSDISPGDYVASVKVTFEDSIGISSDLFEVKAKAIRLIPVPIRDLAPYLVTGIAVVALIMYAFVIPRLGLRGKKRIPKTKEEESKEESKLLKTEEKIKKLEKELAASESAYKSGFISKESYKNNKERVKKELDKLRKE